MTTRIRLHQKGFTIIELLIATAVLATILLLVSAMMISIGKLYYKGINQARVQDNVRSISDEVSQRLQLSNQALIGPVNGLNGAQAYCIGTTRYSYVIGVQMKGSTVPHVFWRDTISTAGGCPVANLGNTNPSLGTDVGGGNATNGAELVTPNARLISFSISPSSSPYTINVGVAYGDNDLLCSPAVAGSCASTSAMTNQIDYQHGDLLCKGNIGDQFCAIANLSTTVSQRLTDN